MTWMAAGKVLEAKGVRDHLLQGILHYSIEGSIDSFVGLPSSWNEWSRCCRPTNYISISLSLICIRYLIPFIVFGSSLVFFSFFNLILLSGITIRVDCSPLTILPFFLTLTPSPLSFTPHSPLLSIHHIAHPITLIPHHRPVTRLVVSKVSCTNSAYPASIYLLTSPPLSPIPHRLSHSFKASRTILTLHQ